MVWLTSKTDRRSTTTLLAISVAAVVIASVQVFIALGSQSVQWVVPQQHPMQSIAGTTISDRLEAMVMDTDGGSSVELARHLALNGPGLASYAAVLNSPQHSAYRAQRVAQPAVVALLVGANHRRSLVMNTVVSVVSVAMLCCAIAQLLVRQGRSMWWALLATLIPGVTAATTAGTSDVVSMAALLGAVVALRSGRNVRAMVLLCVAVLARETWLPVVALIAVCEPALARRTRTMLICAPLLSYLSWAVAVRVSIGYWSALSGRGNVVAVPLQGAMSFATRDASLVGPLAGIAALCLGAVGVYRLRDRSLAVVGWFQLVQLMFLSAATWNLAANFNRVALAVPVIGLLGLLGRSGVSVVDAIKQQPAVVS
jgi:hypothetical protein